ncbi:MAG: cell division protein FtsA, partial [Nitrospirae bacterium]|nr:cell division protein FtsA [Nitrospirota bacterium]
EVIDIVLEPLASSLATLKEEEMKQGVVMIDIGGGTTDIAFYKNNGLAYTSVVAIGGNHITNDIAIGLRLPVDEAERVKMAYGTVLPDNGTDEEIGIMVAGRERKNIPRSYLYEIINPRCEELLEIVKGELEKCGAYEEAIYGVVLTGGASQLKGLDRMAEAVLGLPVRIGFPENLSGLGDSVSDPKYSTGVGLLMYGAQNETQPVITGDMFGGILTRMKNWVKGFLGKQ